MDAILVYNDASKPEVKYTAEQFERVLKNRPGILSKAHLVSAVERKDVDFHPRSRREGFMKEVSPYFARVAGTVNAPHVITRKKKTLQQEIDEGEKAIVFNLNLNLSHRLPIMAQENPKLGFNYDEWKHENSHVAVSIKESAKKIRTVLLQVFNSAVSKTVAPEGRIFASYRGAVMPFNEFALNILQHVT